MNICVLNAITCLQHIEGNMLLITSKWKHQGTSMDQYLGN